MHNGSSGTLESIGWGPFASGWTSQEKYSNSQGHRTSFINPGCALFILYGNDKKTDLENSFSGQGHTISCTLSLAKHYKKQILPSACNADLSIRHFLLNESTSQKTKISRKMYSVPS